MMTQMGLDKCPPFISSQMQPNAASLPASEGRGRRLAITISRQTGCGAHIVGERVAQHLHLRFPDETRPWAVFDRNLVEKVLDDHNLPRRLERFMPEDKMSEFTDVLEELLGTHPPYWTLIRHTSETILRLADRGNVIIIGRAANVITRGLNYAFHVRLVGSLEKRLAHVQQVTGLDGNAALDYIRKEDRGRQRYLKKYFEADLDNPLLYHLVINTDLVSYDRAAAMITDGALDRFYKLNPAPERRAADISAF
jgi:cytidylate kinase